MRKIRSRVRVLRIMTILGLALPAGVLADELASDRPAGRFETVATFDGPMPTGVTVSRPGRIFRNFPKWGDKVDFTVAELKEGRSAAYPDEAINRPEGGPMSGRLISAQSVVVDPEDRLWIVDTGSIKFSCRGCRSTPVRCASPAEDRSL